MQHTQSVSIFRYEIVSYLQQIYILLAVDRSLVVQSSILVCQWLTAPKRVIKLWIWYELHMHASIKKSRIKLFNGLIFIYKMVTACDFYFRFQTFIRYWAFDEKPQQLQISNKLCQHFRHECCHFSNIGQNWIDCLADFTAATIKIIELLFYSTAFSNTFIKWYTNRHIHSLKRSYKLNAQNRLWSSILILLYVCMACLVIVSSYNTIQIVQKSTHRTNERNGQRTKIDNQNNKNTINHETKCDDETRTCSKP